MAAFLSWILGRIHQWNHLCLVLPFGRFLTSHPVSLVGMSIEVYSISLDAFWHGSFFVDPIYIIQLSNLWIIMIHVTSLSFLFHEIDSVFSCSFLKLIINVFSYYSWKARPENRSIINSQLLFLFIFSLTILNFTNFSYNIISLIYLLI